MTSQVRTTPAWLGGHRDPVPWLADASVPVPRASPAHPDTGSLGQGRRLEAGTRSPLPPDLTYLTRRDRPNRLIRPDVQPPVFERHHHALSRLLVRCLPHNRCLRMPLHKSPSPRRTRTIGSVSDLEKQILDPGMPKEAPPEVVARKGRCYTSNGIPVLARRDGVARSATDLVLTGSAPAGGVTLIGFRLDDRGNEQRCEHADDDSCPERDPDELSHSCSPPTSSSQNADHPSLTLVHRCWAAGRGPAAA